MAQRPDSDGAMFMFACSPVLTTIPGALDLLQLAIQKIWGDLIPSIFMTFMTFMVAKPGNEKDLTLANSSILCKISLSEQKRYHELLQNISKHLKTKWWSFDEPVDFLTKWWSELGNEPVDFFGIPHFQSPLTMSWSDCRCQVENARAALAVPKAWQERWWPAGNSGPASITKP